MKHKHDEVIRAWLDGKTVQACHTHGWMDIVPIGEYEKMPCFSVLREYRIKPETTKYRKYIYNYFGTLSVGLVNEEHQIKATQNSTLFIRWLDSEWQEVEV